MTGALVGRRPELDLVSGLLARSRNHGEAHILEGDAGVGKTALLDEAARTAAASGFIVLRAAGVQFEADISFAAVHQVLLTLFPQFPGLSAAHRDALSVALGFADGPIPDLMLVSNATLTLLRRAAAASCVLVIVDDLQWIDRASAKVLGFVARRLGDAAVGFLGAERSGEDSFFDRSGLPVYEVAPLDDDAASELMAARFPTLARPVIDRLLAEAQGNPLAVLELPAALSLPERTALRALPALLPLSQRLQAVFAARVGQLTDTARRLLRLAALDGTGDVGVLQAAGLVAQVDRDLVEVEHARLAHIDDSTHRLAFRHPLIRSAVVQLSTADERRQAHKTLAAFLKDQPDRQAWHLAAATVAPDELVAELLEHAAHRLLRRGDAVASVTALIRSSEVSPSGPDRSRRLAAAAYIGADVAGNLQNAQLIAQTEPTAAALQFAVTAAHALLNGEGDVDTAHRLLVNAIEAHERGGYDKDGALVEALYTLLLVCYFGGRPELWPRLEAVASRIDLPAVVQLSIKTLADPVRTAAGAINELEEAIGGLADEVDPTQIVRIALASVYVDRLPSCRAALWRVVRDGRAGGAVASGLNAQMLLSRDSFLTGQWAEAQQLAEDAVRQCEDRGYVLLAWPGRYIRALIAAARGEYEATRAATDEMIGWAAARRLGLLQCYARQARGLAALGRGDFDQAYRLAAATSPPGVLASHVPYAPLVMMDLVESAVRTGRHKEATRHVHAIRKASLSEFSGRLALLAAASQAIAAPEKRAHDLFERALSIPGVDQWPFDLARVQLVYGERLRRQRAAVEARAYLTVAVETFERLGARPWAARAANELRATGQTRRRGPALDAHELTPQELEIATLAAGGLTNRQIGDRLFLSPKTVAAHLYRAFPKLGITSRAALRDALDALGYEPDANGDTVTEDQ
ncbi:MAG: helix-turn-helix transcriptional regulator [Solirubrobacteraceae bacterium]